MAAHTWEGVPIAHAHALTLVSQELAVGAAALLLDTLLGDRGVGGATACFYFGCMAIPGKVLAWERRSRAAHLLILDDKVQGDGHGKAPEGNIQRSPSRESEAQVVILLVLRPLLNCRVAVTRAPKGCERVGEGREAHMRGVRVERGRCSRTPAQRISRCTTITTTKTHLLGVEGSCVEGSCVGAETAWTTRRPVQRFQNSDESLRIAWHQPGENKQKFFATFLSS